jgi:hypothetical protein
LSSVELPERGEEVSGRVSETAFFLEPVFKAGIHLTKPKQLRMRLEGYLLLKKKLT